MENQFERWHPAAQFVYYAAVLGVSVFTMHPVITGISFAAAAFLGILIDGRAFRKMFFCLYLPAMAIGIIINPLFSHEGVTILWYFPDGNPLTAESIIYGVMSGVMIGNIFTLFFSFNKVMTSDRIIYLTGRAFPRISLIISMALRFIPEFKRHLSEVVVARKCIGKGAGGKNILTRIKNACQILGIMATWAFESSVARSDSMTARGYGLGGRTNYSIFRITKRDAVFMAAILFSEAAVIAGIATGRVYARYYPYFEMNGAGICVRVIYILHAAACVLPALDILAEEAIWKSLRSKT